MKQKSIDRIKQAESAAYLRSRGLMIKEIGAVLAISVGKVDALLKTAAGMGLLHETVRFVKTKVPRERWRDLAGLDTMAALGQKLIDRSPTLEGSKRRVFQRLTVVPTLSRANSRREMDARLERFRIDVSSTLWAILKRSKVVGVAYGTTLGRVISGLEETNPGPSRRRRLVQFVPTCGEPYGTSVRADSSSHLAAELHRIVNEDTGSCVSLAGVPAVIPQKVIEKGAHDAFREFIDHCRNYRRVFGSSKDTATPLVDRFDTVITSVGMSEGHWRMCGEELCDIGGINRDEFRKWILGDIGGVLLPRSNGQTPKSNELLKQYAAQWTGISRKQYELVARRGKRRGGVVVFAIGGNKAEIVLKVIKEGLVNHLICDQDLAEKLVNVVGGPIRQADVKPGAKDLRRK